MTAAPVSTSAAVPPPRAVPDAHAIKAPIAEELQFFEEHFRAALTTQVGLLDRILHYILRRKGKQMRPMFVLLAAEVAGGITPATYRAAALIELLHTATLIHDDVVDDAEERRGFFSISALWKNKAAVLVGDYLLSRGLLMSLEAGDHDLLRIVSRAVKQMSEGELLQMQKSRSLNLDEPVYFEIIRQKTASLIAACCQAGAASAGADAEMQERMRRFGEDVGMAFQIKDDLIDYGVVNEATALAPSHAALKGVGKPLGLDLREKKLTLPLIHTLNQSSWAERHRLKQVVRKGARNRKEVEWLLEFVRHSGGLSYSYTMMNRYTASALAMLEDMPPSAALSSLRGLVEYTILREK